MKVVVDAIIYRMQPLGGISRIYSEILPRMCDADDSLRITLLIEGKLRQSLPEHSHITRQSLPFVRRYLRPEWIWRPIIPPVRRFVQHLWVGSGEGQIWHSTYFTLPESWAGTQVVTVADMIYERYAEFFNRPRDEQFREKKRRCIQQADAVICISEATRQDVQHLYESDSIYVIPLAHSDIFRLLEQQRDKMERPTEQPFLLYVGSRGHYKNFARLIHAYGVWSRRKEVSLVVVGQPWSDDEKWQLAELGIHDSVCLLTDVDDERLCQLYNQAVAFVYPSLYEGFGIPLLEAMACGCPVIASRIPSTTEVAGEYPIYFEPVEIASLLVAFDMALSEKRNSERVRMGIEHAKCYSWDKTARQTLEVYHALSNPK